MVKISIPNDDDGRTSWAEQIKAKFPAAGASLGFTIAEIDAFIADCETVQFAIRHARAARNFSRAATKYKKAILGGKVNAPDAPEFEMTAKPAVLTEPGAFKRIEKVVKRMATHTNFSPVVGESLMIIAAHSAALNLAAA